MCGIIGIVEGTPGRNVVPDLMEGLRRLEYRGYDSAGVATIGDGRIDRVRSAGKLSALQERLAEEPVAGSIGVGHTRWATHGSANETNAHPHMSGAVAIVHNGIIENHSSIRARLQDSGRDFETDTDTEVIAHLIDEGISSGLDPLPAVLQAVAILEGAYALAIIFASHKNLMIVARHGSPLVIGLGSGANFVGSDALALQHLSTRIQYLEDGDVAVIEASAATIYDLTGSQVKRPAISATLQPGSAEKGEYRHFMLKEINEQPRSVTETLDAYIAIGDHDQHMPLPFDAPGPSRVTIVACGTAYYAGAIARHWFETIARVPTDVDFGSEFRSRESDMPDGGMALFISQSGETMDTLQSLRHAKSERQSICSIVNVPGSSIARESDVVWPTFAGPEIGVASTKAFTTQLVVLACLTLRLAQLRRSIASDELARLASTLMSLPRAMTEVLDRQGELERIAKNLERARDILFLGRGAGFPLAMEGALKLKELSYIHAEGYAAGEMKHGPIALIDEHVPVVVVAPTDGLFDKTASNVREAAARGGRVVLFTDQTGADRLANDVDQMFVLPTVDSFAAPILHALPMQLLAYQVAVLKGTDVDQPRNLAKSVTVE